MTSERCLPLYTALLLLTPSPFSSQTRTWVRDVKPSSTSKISGPSVPYAPSSTAQSTTSATSLRVPPLLPLSTLAQSLKNSWSFKGYSLSFYKSLLYPLASGVSFRLPITQNFAAYFSRPYLPAVSTSLGVYYPPR